MSALREDYGVLPIGTFVCGRVPQVAILKDQFNFLFLHFCIVLFSDAYFGIKVSFFRLGLVLI